jgi:uncharacterized membrane protein (UPF0127 family)
MGMLVRNETRGCVLAEFAEIADDSAARRKGLLGRNELPQGHALWIVPCESVHTFGMRFTIDVLYLDRKKKVRKTRPCLRPWRVSMCLLAHSVLELPAGTIEKTGTQPGDQLSLTPCAQA